MNKIFSFDFKLKLYWIWLHLITLYCLLISFDIVGIVLSYIIYLLVKGLGSEIGAHRYFTHKSFNTTKFKQNLLIGLQTFAGEGSILSFVGIHRLHHAFADTDKDPHSPIYKPWYKVIFLLDPPNIPVNIVRDCIKNPIIKLQHQYYFHLQAITIIFLFLSPWIYLYCIAIPMLLSIYTNGFINYYLHRHGTKVKGTNARNHKYCNILLYGAGYHGNHHVNPNDYRYNNNAWLDPIGEIIYRWFLQKTTN